MRPALKICGIKSASELELLDTHRIDYAGLWYGITEGHNNLDLSHFKQLAKTTSKHTKHILVTISQDLETLKQAISDSGVYGIQFHGFPLPSFISQVKKIFGGDLKIFNVLHIHQNRCLEQHLIERYLDAGTDFFIIDSFQSKNSIGSTGIRLDENFLDNFYKKWNIREMSLLAGGIDESCLRHLETKYNPYGFDIDSSVKTNGRLCQSRLERLISSNAKLQLLA